MKQFDFQHLVYRKLLIQLIALFSNVIFHYHKHKIYSVHIMQNARLYIVTLVCIPLSNDWWSGNLYYSDIN